MWKIAISKRITGSDTIWRNTENDQLIAISDGTNPSDVEGELLGYIVDVSKLDKPIPLSVSSVGGIVLPTMNNRGISVRQELVPYLMQYVFGKKAKEATFYIPKPNTQWFN